VDSFLAVNILATAAVGIGATAVMDGWANLQKRLFGLPSLDYRFVGRWIGHFPEGRVIYDSISHVAAVRGEMVLGWAAHYAIGVVLAGLLVLIDPHWLQHPILLPALVVGFGSIAVPFFVMQPSFGSGIAASYFSGLLLSPMST
jgi:hypothetical protein